MLVTVDAVTGTISDRRLCTLWPEDASCPRWTAWESGSLRMDVGARKTKLYVFGQGIRHASVTSVSEVKRANGKLSPLQKYRIEELKKLGFNVEVHYGKTD